jgi:hypothetical protein
MSERHRQVKRSSFGRPAWGGRDGSKNCNEVESKLAAAAEGP